MTQVTIRRAEARDLPALLRIYNYYVINTPITFDVEPRTIEQRLAWFQSFAPEGRHQCFVAVRGDEAIGWASSSQFKERAAYGTSVETSIYLAPDECGKGLGRRLCETLIAALENAEVHRAFGGVTLPNDASVGLHAALGFRNVGTFHEVGRKFGRFWDVAWFELVLAWP